MKKAIINSLPKAGTHLLAQCLELFGYRGRGHLGAGRLIGRHPVYWARRLAWSSFRQGYLLGIDSPIEVARGPVNRRLRGVGDGEFITAHVGYTEDLLRRAIDFGLAPILVTRDPRAVINSFVPYVAGRKTHALYPVFSKLSREEQYRVALEGYFPPDGAGVQSMRTRCAAIEPWLRCDGTIVIRFEDLVGAKGGGSDEAQKAALDRLCRGLDLPAEKLPAVADELFGPGQPTFRKGRVDSWREETPPEMIERIESELGDVLVAWRY